MSRRKFNEALDGTREWQAGKRANAAGLLVDLEEQDVFLKPLSDEERADLREALAEAERGEFATDEEVEAVFARYRR